MAHTKVIPIDLVPLEVARAAFLMVIATRAEGSVSRGYLAEKIKAIYKDDASFMIRGRLDPVSQRRFNELVAGVEYDLNSNGVVIRSWPT